MKILLISPTQSGIGGIAQHVQGLKNFLEKKENFPRIRREFALEKKVKCFDFFPTFLKNSLLIFFFIHHSPHRPRKEVCF